MDLQQFSVLKIYLGDTDFETSPEEYGFDLMQISYLDKNVDLPSRSLIGFTWDRECIFISLFYFNIIL